MSELSADNTRVAVCPCDLAPDDSNLRTLNFALGPVDERNFLSEVEGGGLGVFYALKLDKTCVGVCGALSTLVAQMPTLDI